ncbi:MAG: alpha-ketoglutarate-dependent dioxygenase AlkB [Flavisolibacter sp.]
MNLLFPIETSYPAGFSYTEEFINSNEEEELLKSVEQTEMHSMLFHGYEAKRRVANYGYDWNFEKRNLKKGKEIPGGYSFLIEKVADHLRLAKDAFGELLVTEYPAGSVINWHRDAPPFDLIAGISLLSDCIFKLRPYDKSKQNRKSIVSLTVKRRSLYILQGAARSEWEHSIAAVKQRRYSITLRTLKK